MDGLFVLLSVMSLLSLALGLLLVYNTMNAVIAAQVDQIGVLKAVGARTGQVFRLFLTESFSLWAAGAAAGAAYRHFWRLCHLILAGLHLWRQLWRVRDCSGAGAGHDSHRPARSAAGIDLPDPQRRAHHGARSYQHLRAKQKSRADRARGSAHEAGLAHVLADASAIPSATKGASS